MNRTEYAKLEAVDARHWFYVGKRQIVFHWLRKEKALAKDRLLVDCGAGTGRFVREARAFCNAIAVDNHGESLVIARRYLGEDAVRRGSCLSLPFGEKSADIVTGLDVLEHLDDDSAALREMTRILKPGGVIVITTPALMMLWSDWDVALHHHRRYRKRQLKTLAERMGLAVTHCNYINVAALPAVWFLRKWRTHVGRNRRTTRARIEEFIPPAPLNRLLLELFVRPACQSFLSFPFGVSLLMVARKPPLSP